MNSTLLNEEQADEIIDKVTVAMRENSSWRYGQALFNVLYMQYPKLADAHRGTATDTYYVTPAHKAYDMFLEHYVETK